MQNFEELYKYLYDKLVDISNAKVLTIRYTIGTSKQVCNRYDTVRIAKDVMRHCQPIKYTIIIWNNDETYSSKTYVMLDAISQIANAKKIFLPKEFEDVCYYYKEDTVDIAKICLENLNKNI